jgi:protein-L-isoaspartate(D-aspartate) O-methyltransferase
LLSVIGLKVVAQEEDPKLAALLAPALEDYGVELVVADLKTPARTGVDLIVCEGAVARAPEAWLAALAPNGRLTAVERQGPVGRAREWVRSPSGVSAGHGFDATPPHLPGFEPQPAFQF